MCTHDVMNQIMSEESIFILIAVYYKKLYLFTAGDIPQDRFYYKSVNVPPSIPAFVIIFVGNTLCMATAVIFLTFNIYYRKNRFVLRERSHTNIA